MHRLTRHTRRRQHKLHFWRKLTIGLPRIEHIDPDRTHSNFTAAQHVERTGIAWRQRCIGGEVLERGKGLIPVLGFTFFKWAFHELIGIAAIGINPAHHEAHA
ncbi:hypothetical protein D3C87_1785980 [compost metagenome]